MPVHALLVFGLESGVKEECLLEFWLHPHHLHFEELVFLLRVKLELRILSYCMGNKWM